MFIDTETLEYPLTAPQIIAANPHISFPVPFALPDGYAQVQAVEPPTFDAETHKLVEQTPVRGEGAWFQSWSLVPLTEDEANQRAAARGAALAQARKDLKAAATAMRWAVETGGIALPDGTPIKTAIEDQNRIDSAVTGALRLGLQSVRFKGADDTFVEIPLEALVQIANAIAMHVQECFAAEGDHYAAIDALTDEQLGAYDLSAGWPANSLHLAN